MSLIQSPPAPLAAAVAVSREALAGVRDMQPLYLSTGEKERLLTELAGLEAQVVELRLRTLAVAGDVAESHGSRDVAGWFAKAVHADPARVRAEERLASVVADRFTATAAALAKGGVNLEQVRVITACVDDLPDRVGVAVKQQAEADLIRLAADFGPAELRRLGRAILHVSAPEIADAEDARRLAEQERHAEEKASVRFRPVGDGTTKIHLRVADAVAGRFETYLDGWTNPRHPNQRDQHDVGNDGAGSNPDVVRLPRHRQLAEAFRRLLEHLDPSKLPDQGGDATSVVVTIGIKQLLSGMGAATTTNPLSPTGTTDISAAEARRLACTGGVIPAVLGGESEVLDLGRKQRLFSTAIRRALRLRDPVCRGEGCTIPARWCEAHHLQPWALGGVTSLGNGILLCGFHHHRIHDQVYDHDTLPDGDIRFHRRA
ncbi:DUF222 domain-containing protein [Nocardioides sp. LHD-245]|uniref:HNH endonuclease signature motif containing protein n=1 Tax=Nocardioides sp. LHD-245 TaxID=3051387 RepID=UPI0027E20353|nr:DUF222 domain-containing protein [Nocardioides sp. LHD-245]